MCRPNESGPPEHQLRVARSFAFGDGMIYPSMAGSYVFERGAVRGITLAIGRARPAERLVDAGLFEVMARRVRVHGRAAIAERLCLFVVRQAKTGLTK